MRNNTKKGFTLVELLVVIAILAILATVSVVGYTSFIERANVAADQNEVTQLNHFLAVLKSDNSSKFFNKDLNEWNVRAATKEILDMVGWGELNPRSGENGYNVYFDLDKQEYILARDTDIINGTVTGVGASPLTSLLGYSAGERGDHLGNSMSKGGKYFLVSTAGNALANFVEKFYNLGVNAEGEYEGFDGDDAENWRSEAGALGSAYDVVKDFANNASVANGSDAHHPVDGENKHLIYPDNSQNQIPDTTLVKDAETGLWIPDNDKALVSGDYLPVPDDAETVAESTLKKFEGTDTEVGVDSAERLASMLEEGRKSTDKAEGTKTPSISIKISTGETISIGTEVKTEGGATLEVSVVIKPDGATVECSFSNEVKDFYISVTDADNMKNTGNRTNTAYVATEVGSFTVNVEYIGKDENLPATGRNIVEWTLKSGSGAEGDDRTITFGADPSETIVLTAKSANGTERDFTIHVGKTTAATVELAGKFLNSTSTIYLVHGGKSNVHEIKLGDLSYNDAGKNLKLDTTLDVTYSGTGLTEENNVLTTSGNGTGTLTVKVGKYLTYTVNVVVFDKASLPVGTVENISVLAQGSATAPIKISDLFVANDASKIPADAEVRFTVIDADDQYVEFDRDYVSYVKDATGNAITSLAWTDTAGFYFSDVSGEDTIAISVFSKDGTRISDDVIVKVVSGDNARTWADINKEIKTNVVLLNNITFPADAQLVISGGTFYGNDYVLDVRNAKKDAAEHIIKLTNATLDNVNIVGKVYTGFTYQDHYASGTVDSTSIVVANKATIRNCYIANGRSPVRVIGDTIIADSTIFGGRYANIDVAKGKLTLTGKVITINQLYEGVIGGGIVCDMTKETNYVVTTGCDLVQYNFVPQTSGSALPTVSVTIKILTYGATISIPMGDMTASLMNESQYSPWVYQAKDNNNNVTESYINSGIIYLTATGKGTGMSAAVGQISKDNKSSGTVPDGYELATYTQTYRPGPDMFNLYLYANAHMYSPAAKVNGADSQFVSTLFKDAMDSTHMAQYLPTNYVEGAMK